MKTKTLFCLAFLTPLIWLGVVGNASAQPRVSTGLGQTGVGRAAKSADSTGTISGRERFLRRNRRRTSFVGRDRSELSTFVGQQQATTSGDVRTALEGRRVQFQSNANLSTQRTNQTDVGIYEPQLSVRFDLRPTPPASFGNSLAESINRSSKIHRLGPLKVTIGDYPTDARTATLEGVVATDDDRRLAEAYLLFEPGLSRVVNRLTVASPSTIVRP